MTVEDEALGRKDKPATDPKTEALELRAEKVLMDFLKECPNHQATIQEGLAAMMAKCMTFMEIRDSLMQFAEHLVETHKEKQDGKSNSG